jgi:hypothetical protein
MRTGTRSAIAAVGAALAAFVGVTWWALESGGVAVVETQRTDAATRSTHVWYVERDGEIWLEAGSPTNGWFVDTQRNAELRFVAGDLDGRYLAAAVSDASGHRQIRDMIRAKYGFRDRWINWIIDTSDSLAVRLIPLGGV